MTEEMTESDTWEVVYSREEQMANFLGEVRPHVRHAAIGAVIIATVSLPYAILKWLAYIGVRDELLGVPEFVDSIGTVVVFAIFWYAVILRAINWARSKGKED